MPATNIYQAAHDVHRRLDVLANVSLDRLSDEIAFYAFFFFMFPLKVSRLYSTSYGTICKESLTFCAYVLGFDNSSERGRHQRFPTHNFIESRFFKFEITRSWKLFGYSEGVEDNIEIHSYHLKTQ